MGINLKFFFLHADKENKIAVKNETFSEKYFFKFMKK